MTTRNIDELRAVKAQLDNGCSLNSATAAEIIEQCIRSEQAWDEEDKFRELANEETDEEISQLEERIERLEEENDILRGRLVDPE